MKSKKVIFSGVAIVILLAIVFALPDGAHRTGVGLAAGNDGSTTEKSGSVSHLALRLVLALVVVLVLILGSTYALRHLRGPLRSAAGGNVQVLDRCYLAPRKALYTVRMGERVVVVGVTDAAITPVVELSPEEGAKLTSRSHPPGHEVSGFARILRKIMGGSEERQT